MKVKIKKLSPDAVIPSYAKDGDAGLDLVSIGSESTIDYIEYKTGLAVEIPKGYVGLIFPRSSISNKELILANSVGVVDSGYRGEIKVRFKRTEQLPGVSKTYYHGDKVAQLVIMPIPYIDLVEVSELGASERGEGGFGHTDYAQQVSESPLHYKHNE